MADSFRRIHALPPHIVGQIKSSVSITSLNVAILGLIENSLDSDATKVDISVDFRRGGCVVEDDGFGIPPFEFSSSGGLGKMHRQFCGDLYQSNRRNSLVVDTSKFTLSESVHGQNGIFLASLTSLSLLTIVSHHHLHRSTNSLTLNRSGVLARHTPAPASQNIIPRSHGTRVIVHDLFGNMPVRIKHRALVQDDKVEFERNWEDLKLSILALLISWDQPVLVKVKTSDGNRSMTMSTAAIAAAHKPDLYSPVSIISRFPALLVQAGLVPSSNHFVWIPASASSKTLSIKGVIALQPSPTKQMQFISLGIRPLPAKSGHNELYENINRLFKQSSFGALENEETSRNAVGRDSTSLRKGVERWPMFYLQITLKQSQKQDSLIGDGELDKVIAVIDALVTSWLSAHHFRTAPRIAPTRTGGLRQSEQGTDSTMHCITSIERSSSRSHSRKRQKPNQVKPITKEHVCVDTTDISSESDPVSKMVRRSKVRPEAADIAGDSKVGSSLSAIEDCNMGSPKVSMPDSTLSGFTSEMILPRQFNAVRRRCSAQTLDATNPTSGSASSVVADVSATADIDNDVVNWTDSITGQTHKINSRTGNAVTPDTSAVNMIVQPETRLTFRSRNPANSSQSAGWIDKLFGEWQNPVFKSTEWAIPRASFSISSEDISRSRSGHFQHPGANYLDRAFQETSLPTAERLSKERLKNARVVAQVDNKFILISIPANDDTEGESSIIVAVDQHAADERHGVENLMTELCSPPEDTNTFRSNLGLESLVKYDILPKPLVFRLSSQEMVHFQRQAEDFAEWGILYDISNIASTHRSGDTQSLAIRTLPTSIAERLGSDPELLISLLRTELWLTVENGKAGRTLRTADMSTSDGKTENKHPWLQRIGRCPKGILDMISSRACRSAIMFNDPLSHDECEKLLRRLSDCAFPFQCAHGRPSMVPLIRLGANTAGTEGSLAEFGLRDSAIGPSSHVKEDICFVNAFQRWAQRSHGISNATERTAGQDRSRPGQTVDPESKISNM